MYRTLVFALLLTLSLACEGAIRDPVGLGGGGDGTGGTGGGGGGGGGTSGSLLVGSWEAVFIFELPNDIQRHTVTWTFTANNVCRRTVEVFSVLEDRTLTNVSDCTFSPGGGDVAITFAGSSSPVTFRWSLADFSRDRLLLDGVVYDRIG